MYEYLRAIPKRIAVSRSERGGQIGNTGLDGIQDWPCTFASIYRYFPPDSKVIQWIEYLDRFRLHKMMDLGETLLHGWKVDLC